MVKSIGRRNIARDARALKPLLKELSWINVKQRGPNSAKGDGTTDDITALQAAADSLPTNGGVLYLPKGEYRISTGLDLPFGASLIGSGRDTIISPTAGFSPSYTPEETGLLNVGDVANAGTSSYWRGVISNLHLKGSSVAACEVGLYMLKCVNTHVMDVHITGFTGGTYSAGMVLDAVQNSQFDNIYINNVDTGLLLVNGTANNNFNALQVTCWNDNSKDIHLVRLQGANSDFYGEGLTANDHIPDNTFVGGIIETYAGADAAFLIDDGDNNAVYGMTIAQSHNATCYQIVRVLSGANHNKFDSCNFTRVSESAAGNILENRGPDTQFHQCVLTNTKSGDEIHTYGRTHVIRCHLGSATIANQSGNIYDNVHFEPESISGTTANRPAPGDAYFHYFDIDMKAMIWYDPVNDQWSHFLSAADDNVELTISGGVVTATQGYHTIDTENNDASDDLDTINGGNDGDILIIRPIDGSHTVVAKDGTDLRLAGDFSMDTNYDTLTLIKEGSVWIELARSNNA